MRQSIRAGLGLLLVGGLGLGLSACANPVDELIQKGTEEAIERAVEESTGGQVDINTGSGASLPEGWPDLPVPEGEITFSSSTTDGKMLSMTASRADVEAVIEELKAAGYAEESVLETGDGKILSLAGAEWVVTLTYTNDASDPDAVVLNYLVTPAAA